jgi:hypothetical protein
MKIALGLVAIVLPILVSYFTQREVSPEHALREAIVELERKKSENPEDLALSNQLAEAYARVRAFESAEKLLRAALAQGAEKMTMYNNLGNIHFLQGHSDSALVNYLKALSFGRTSADSAGIYRNLEALFAADTVLADTVGIRMGLFAEFSQQWEVRVGDGKKKSNSKGNNKDQKIKSGQKKDQGKQKTAPGGNKANAGPIEVQVALPPRSEEPGIMRSESMGATGHTFLITSLDSLSPPKRNELEHYLFWARY